MDNISTELGKIYCKYNSESDNFDMYRVANIINEDNNKKYLLFSIDDKTYHFYSDESDCKILNTEDYGKE